MTDTNSSIYKSMLEAAKDYCVFAGIEPTTLGRVIVNDGKFFERIENGGGCTMKTYQNVMTWFKQNKPKKRTRK